jgi:hypothetical protein
MMARAWLNSTAGKVLRLFVVIPMLPLGLAGVVFMLLAMLCIGTVEVVLNGSRELLGMFRPSNLWTGIKGLYEFVFRSDW